MTVSTTSAAFYITPVVLKTLFQHFQAKGRKVSHNDIRAVATDDVFFDEAFHIVKAFIELGTLNTIESLQAFTNTHVIAPYWAAVSPVLIPLSSCNKAADVLIDWFGPDDLKCVVGGEKWWQVRGLDGLEAEWITEKEFLGPVPANLDKKLSSEDTNILRMENLDTVMFYVHGGGYFWGSINTHRYQMIRYARKMKGRVFAVNYRKAPQYPWPCPVHDILTAYFYLTNPPPGALHKPVPPSKIVIAGDSAGGGLCVAALTVLRDMGIQQPAGAVSISPWVDLTHSFPSVMGNTATDIIPPHGFIHKPSAIWPIHPIPPNGEPRAIPTKTNPPPLPGHADTLRPSKERLADQVEQRTEQSDEEQRPVAAGDLEDDNVKDQKTMQKEDYDEKDDTLQHSGPSYGTHQTTIRDDDPNYDDALSFWEPKPPKVLMNDPHATSLELRSQIQIYAANEQLTHPLVSPVLQGSLGNLCPLYIIAGDAEVLRDEVMYLAHKAAHPQDYPTRKGVLSNGVRQRENTERFQTPTKVHLQVFDGMCHVLTVFTFTDSAKYAYRSIAQFVKHVTTHSAEHLDTNPFPEFHVPPEDISASEESLGRLEPKRAQQSSKFVQFFKRSRGTAPPPIDSQVEKTDVGLYKENERVAKEEHEIGATETMAEDGEADPGSSRSSSKGKDIPGVRMLRERVDIFGQVRPMEPESEIEALHIPPRLIGVIREDPVKRWLSGQEEWDKKFHRQAVRAVHRRDHYHKKFDALMERARAQGLELFHDADSPDGHRQERSPMVPVYSRTSMGEIIAERRYGPCDIADEQPPESAIVGRRDNRESLALMKKCIYFTAPRTHRTVPKRTAADAFRAAVDTEDHVLKSPKQSVAEQQSESNILPIHGLRMWQGILTYFMRKSTVKATKRRHSMPNLNSRQPANGRRGTSDAEMNSATHT